MPPADLHKTTTTDLPDASLAKRLIAAVYDWLLVIAVMMVLSVPLVAIRDDAIATGDLLYRLALIAVAGVFFAGFWCKGGQTLGMRAWRLQVINDDGSALTLAGALLRYGYAWLSFAPAGLGFWWALFNRERRTWHDIWSGTRVVVHPKKPRT